MAIDDVLYDSIIDIIDGCSAYFSNDFLKMAEDEDIVEVVACHLKLANKRGYFFPTEDDLARIANHDWRKEAKKFIVSHLEENYLSGAEDET